MKCLHMRHFCSFYSPSCSRDSSDEFLSPHPWMVADKRRDQIRGFLAMAKYCGWSPRKTPLKITKKSSRADFLKLISLFGEKFPLYHLFSELYSLNLFCSQLPLHHSSAKFDNRFHDISAIYSSIIHNLASVFDHWCPMRINMFHGKSQFFHGHAHNMSIQHRYLVVHPT